MACCDDQTHNMGVSIDLRDLPEETFCCMGRMAYTVASKALEIAAGKSFPAWDTFNERQKLEMGARAKAMAVGDSDGESDVEKVMVVVLRAMATAS